MKLKYVFVGPMSLCRETFQEKSVWQKKPELQELLIGIHSNSFQIKISNIFSQFIPDANNMVAVECLRQKTDLL